MTPKQNYDPETGEPLAQEGLALWQKLLAVLSLALGGVGLALGGTSSAPPEPPPVTATDVDPSAPRPEGFIATAPGQGGAETAPGEGADSSENGTVWAPLLAKGGLSFFLAFCVGYALRAALKVTMIGVGVLALAVFGLQYAGVIGPIDWSKAQGFWGDLTADLGEHFESLKTFVASSLPSAASGTVGLLAGFQRRS